MSAEPRSSAGPRSFTFGRFRLDRHRREVRDVDGARVHLSTKAFDALVYFVTRPGVAIERSELLEALWPGRVVEENNLNQTIAALRRELGAGCIVTVRGHGYQFVAEVRPADEASPHLPRPAGTRGPRRGRWAAVALLALAGLLAIQLARERAAGPTGAPAVGTGMPGSHAAGEAYSPDGAPRIAVLPCENLSPEPDRAYLAAGIHDELVNRLSTLEGVAVLARASMLAYGDPGLSIPELARELDAQAVLECTVNGRGDAVAVALVHPVSGVRVWADTYSASEDEHAPLFDMHADVASRVTAMLGVDLPGAMGDRSADPPTRSPEAYAAFLRAREVGSAHGYAGAETMAWLDRAVELDPSFALAYSARAQGYVSRAYTAWRPSRGRVEHLLERARDDADKAIQLDPELGSAHAMLGAVAFALGDRAAGHRHLDRAVSLGPNDAEVLRMGAGLALLDGRHERSRYLFGRLKRIDPFTYDGYYLFLAGDRDGARESVRRHLEFAPTDPLSHMGYGYLSAVEGNRATAEAQARLCEVLLEGESMGIDILTSLIYIYGRIGLDEDAQRLYGRLEADYGDERDDMLIWWLFAHLGIADVAGAHATAVAVSERPLPPYPSAEYEFIHNSSRRSGARAAGLSGVATQAGIRRLTGVGTVCADEPTLVNVSTNLSLLIAVSLLG